MILVIFESARGEKDSKKKNKKKTRGEPKNLAAQICDGNERLRCS